MNEDNPKTSLSTDYDVGYKKPPKATQFKKGESGNKKGRPKKSRNMRTILLRELSSTIELTEGGETKRISKAEAAVKRLLMNAMKGDMRALVTLFKLSSDDPDLPMDEKLELKSIERDILAGFAKRHSKTLPADNQEIEEEDNNAV